MITVTRRESMVVRGVTGAQIAVFHPHLQYIGLDVLYQLFVMDTIMAVTKYSKPPTKLLTKKSPKLRSF